MWHPTELSIEEIQYLADSFNAFLDVTLKKVRQHRVLFPPLHQPAISNLDNLLRYILGFFSTFLLFMYLPYCQIIYTK